MPSSRPLALLLAAFLVGCADADGDGFSGKRDCDDTRVNVNKKAEEVCDGLDNDCDGQIDEGVAIVAYWDRDRDGFGDEASARRVCVVPEDGSTEAGDCDDRDASTYPGAPEVCDERDNDCNGEVDEGVQNTFYADTDGDGHGDPAVPTNACFVPDGHAPSNDDCDDSDGAVGPSLPELCDGIDNNCNGTIDEDQENAVYFADADGDGYGDPGQPILGCPGIPAATNDWDCNDADANIGPHVSDIAGNNTDEDCDGYVDELGVPDTYATLGDALAVADAGDVVQLDGGTHILNIDLRGHDVVLAGEGCGRTTVIADTTGPTLRMDQGSVENLTLTGGSGLTTSYVADPLKFPAGTDGGGLLVEAEPATTVRVSDVCFEGNFASRFGGGIAHLSGHLELRGSRFDRNGAGSAGGGVFVGVDATADIQTSHFTRNDSGREGGGLSTIGGNVDVQTSVFAANEAEDYGAGASARTHTVNGDTPAALVLDQVTLHANRVDAAVATSASPAVYAAGVDTTLTLGNSLVTGHSQAKESMESRDSATLVLGALGVWGNGASERAVGYQMDAFRAPPSYVAFDSSTEPDRWDFRLMPDSGFRDVLAVRDTDGSAGDLGAFGGGSAPASAQQHLDDDDGDGLTNGYEFRHLLNPYRDDSGDDIDGDGLDNAAEQTAGSDPRVGDTDGDGQGDADEVSAGFDPIDPSDQRPVADAPLSTYGAVGASVQVSSDGSWDPNGDPLQFQWQLTPPAGSQATLASTTAPEATFTPDVPGSYGLTLTVSDGQGESVRAVSVYAVDAAIVPDDYPTIDAAVAAGERNLALRAGTHPAAVDLGGSDFSLIGLAPADQVWVVPVGSRPQPMIRGLQGNIVRVAHLTMAYGYAAQGGAIQLEGDGGELYLSDVTLHRNSAQTDGGALYLRDLQSGVADLYRVRGTHNEALRGGALFVEDTPLTVRQTRWFGNQADEGGAAHLFHTLATGLEWRFANTVWSNNAAAQGSAIFHQGSAATLILRNTALVQNQATDGTVFGVSGTVHAFSPLLLDNEVTLPTKAGVANPLIEEYSAEFSGNAANHYLLDVGSADPSAVLSDRVNPTVEGDPNQAAVSAPPFFSVDPTGALALLTENPYDDERLFNTGNLHRAGFPEDFNDRGVRVDLTATDGVHTGGAAASFADIADVDGDGMPDGWERLMGLDPTVDDSALDADTDGQTNAQEFAAGTHPALADSDGDGLEDGTDADAVDTRASLPTAVITAPTQADPGAEVPLDSSNSTDPNADPLTQTRWSLLYAPAASAVTGITDAATPNARFTPDVAGRYLVQLEVHDGNAWSAPEVTAVYVTAERDLGAYATVDDAIADSFPGDVLLYGPGEHQVVFQAPPFPLTLRGAGQDQTTLTNDDATQAVVNALDGASLTVEDLALTGGSNQTGGGALCKDSALTLRRVTLQHHIARDGAGAYLLNCEARFEDVNAFYNAAYGVGGAVNATGGSLSWRGGEVAFNRAETSGGGLYTSGGDLTLRNLVVRRNWAESSSSAIYFSGSSLYTFDAEFVTIAGNTGDSRPVRIASSGPSGRLVNSIIQGNEDVGLNVSGVFGLDVEDSLIFGNTGGIATGISIPPLTNITNEPAQFVSFDRNADGSADDLHLRDVSPCIDASTSALDPDGSPADLGAYGGPDAPSDFDQWYGDSDGDGMPDGWELDNGLTVGANDASDDLDGDGLSNLDEYGLGTAANSVDTDQDGLDDPTEVAGPTDPTFGLDNRPVAITGPKVIGGVGIQSTLEGGNSIDPNGDGLTYAWSLVAKPGRSTLTDSDVVGATSDNCALTPDTPGTYTLQLIVSDGTAFSAPSTVDLIAPGDLLVPDDYSSLEEAVAEIQDGYTIELSAGAHQGHVIVNPGRRYTIAGQGMEDTTLIPDAARPAPIVAVTAGAELTLRDLGVVGGRYSNGGGAWIRDASLILDSVVFDGNEGVYGGALWGRGATITATDAWFLYNLGSRNGGGVFLQSSSEMTIDRGVFAHNLTTYLNGGGIAFDHSDGALANVLFHDNWAAKNGGALHAYSNSSTPNVITATQLTLTLNGADAGGGGIHVHNEVLFDLHNSILNETTTSYALYESQAGSVDLAYTYFWDNDRLINTSGLINTNGNVEASTLPAATDDGDWTTDFYELAPSSPGIDGGDPAVLDTDGSVSDPGVTGGPLGWVP